MKKIWYVSVLLALLTTLFSVIPIAAADTGVTVSSNAPISIISGGAVVDKLPASVAPSSLVSIERTLFYSSETERWTFQQWSTGSTSPSITVGTAGDYKAIFSHEVLILIKSDATSLQRSMWVPAGIPINVSVPNTVQVDDTTRYRFLSWNVGETPFQTANTIAPIKPTTLEPRWVKEYLLTIQAPSGISIAGAGWYADGSSVIIQPPAAVTDPQNKNTRLSFASWDSQGFPPLVLTTPDKALLTVKMDGPHTLKASYDTQYLVVANTPFGVLKREWVTAGEEVVLEALPVVEIVTGQEQFVFRKWDGMAGLVSPKVSGVINAPVLLTAVYDHQVMITVNATEGALVSGGGWATVGSSATLTAPNSVGSGFAMIKRFKSFPGYDQGSSITFLVSTPVTVTALYAAGPDFGVLLYFMIIPVALILAYAMIRRRSLN